ncbi:MAG: M23 family metallopeptidase [Bacteroidetes bacterium]|nr:M23 family metallopeptidase [Bacteroidota bacterium]
MAANIFNKEGRAQIRENLKNKFRLVIMNEDTFQEIASFKLTLFNFYLLGSSILVSVGFLALLFIAITPIKRYLPGYGLGSSSEEVLSLMRKVEEVENEMSAQRIYLNNVKRMLTGDVETVEDVPVPEKNLLNNLVNLEEKNLVVPSEEDNQLRKEVELENIGNLAKRSRYALKGKSEDMPIEGVFFVNPVKGEITSQFDLKKNHFGVDIVAPKNTAIKAALAGYVFLADWTLETGHTIGIQHTNNLITFYKHNAALLKKVGTFVKAGEAIAIIGNTGTKTEGPHLHFELWYKGIVMDPTDFISF